MALNTLNIPNGIQFIHDQGDAIGAYTPRDLDGILDGIQVPVSNVQRLPGQDLEGTPGYLLPGNPSRVRMRGEYHFDYGQDSYRLVVIQNYPITPAPAPGATIPSGQLILQMTRIGPSAATATPTGSVDAFHTALLNGHAPTYDNSALLNQQPLNPDQLYRTLQSIIVERMEANYRRRVPGTPGPAGTPTITIY